MKIKFLVGLLAAAFISSNLQAAILCPDSNEVNIVGLNQVNRVSEGVFVYRADKYNTQQEWVYMVGDFPLSMSDPVAIANANVALKTMGLVSGPNFLDTGDVMCLYFSPKSHLMGIAMTPSLSAETLTAMTQKIVKFE